MTKAKFLAPHHIIVEDILEPIKTRTSFKVEQGYGGILFVGHFCLSEAEARKLKRYMNAVIKEWDQGRPPRTDK